MDNYLKELSIMQRERWNQFYLAQTDEHREQVLQEILKNARVEGDIMKVYTLAPSRGVAEREAYYILLSCTQGIIPSM